MKKKSAPARSRISIKQKKVDSVVENYFKATQKKD